MSIALIVALSENRVIGNKNQLPWHLPNDLKHFKALTLGKPIIMGRKTFESIGKPLPNRKNIVLTRNKAFKAEGCTVVHDLETALAKANESKEIMIIGGEKIFTQALPLADTLYLTLVHESIQGDAFFPEWDKTTWKEVSREEHPSDEKHAYAFTFLTFKKQ